MRNSWSFFIILFFLGFGNLFGENPSLLQYAPKEADLICVAQMKNLVETPAIKELRKISKNLNWMLNSLEAEMNYYGFTSKTIPEEILYFRGLKKIFSRNTEDVKGLLIKTSIPEKDYYNILNRSVAGNFATLFRKKIMDHRIYIIKINLDKTYITYIKKDILLVVWKEKKLKTAIKSLSTKTRFKMIKMKEPLTLDHLGNF